jgi:hypothetical protein
MPNSSFSRNFAPLLGNGNSDQHMRVSDADRQAVTDRLAVHYGDGRLDQAEFDERAGRAMSAKTRADLAGLLDDLPEPGDGPTGAPGVPARKGREVRRHPHNHGLLITIGIIVIALSAAHAVVWFTASWLWLAFIAVITLAVTGHFSHHHHNH